MKNLKFFVLLTLIFLLFTRSSCNVRKTARSCANGVKDANEMGIDCGGICPIDCTDLCDNGVQDPDETGIDCGGFCGDCPPVLGPCENGVLDKGEISIDCGGPCPDCVDPKCSNGILDAGEIGIDCGGSCEDCPPEFFCNNGIKDATEEGSIVGVRALIAHQHFALMALKMQGKSVLIVGEIVNKAVAQMV